MTPYRNQKSVFTVVRIAHLFSILLSPMFKSVKKLYRTVTEQKKIAPVEIAIHYRVAVSAVDGMTPHL